jgi:hypothetical protein
VVVDVAGTTAPGESTRGFSRTRRTPLTSGVGGHEAWPRLQRPQEIINGFLVGIFQRLRTMNDALQNVDGFFR